MKKKEENIYICHTTFLFGVSYHCSWSTSCLEYLVILSNRSYRPFRPEDRTSISYFFHRDVPCWWYSGLQSTNTFTTGGQTATTLTSIYSTISTAMDSISAISYQNTSTFPASPICFVLDLYICMETTI